MAIIVCQHVAPGHTSTLPEALATATEWPITQARDGERIEPDHVYVNPADADVTVRNATFELVKRSSQSGRHMPIDMLFQSLAADVKTRAAGVVLSGAASDGTEGLRAIKLEGGLTFAQDPRSAQYDSMPRHAIDAGVADFVLIPGQIAAELASLARNYPQRVMPDRALTAWKAEDVARVVSTLRKATGVDFSLYKETTLQRRIQRRMAVHRLKKLSEYSKYIGEHPDEAKTLRDELFIHVTGFFRDEESFDALGTLVFPELIKARSTDNPPPLRIWVPGCASGEEVYSLAFSLLDFMGDKRADFAMQIFGSDIAEREIERARKAIYSEDAIRGLDAKWVNRFFVRTERGYQVSKAVRDLCIFVVHDVAADPPFSKIDLISCRNVLIYFKPELQKRVIPILHYALNIPGFLLLGRTESLTGFGTLFKVIDRTNKIYTKKETGNRVALPGSGKPMGIHKPEPPGPLHRAVPKAADSNREIDHMLLTRYAPASVLVNDDLDILQFRGRTGTYLEPPTGQASMNLMKMAREGLLPDLSKAVDKAKRGGRRVRKEGVRMRTDGHARAVNLEVIPVHASTAGDRHLLVLFEDEAHRGVGGGTRPVTKPKRGTRRGSAIEQLRDELSSTKEYLQSVVEQQAAMNDELTSTNEELLASNEELQSTNEELETAKEELQSSNEELNTVNDELQTRNQELTHLNDDLLNLFASVEIPIVMLDREQKIRRFTPKANEVMRVIPADLGRAFADIKLRIDLPELESWIAEVMARIEPKEMDIRDGQGKWFRLRIRPYLRSAGVFDGVVISLVDIDNFKRAINEASRARDYVTTILQTVPVPLVIVDHELRVRSANRRFYETFRLEAQKTEGAKLPELGGGEWAEQDLLRSLSDVVQRGSTLDGFEIDRTFPGMGQRSLLIGARPLPASDAGTPLAVLTIQDITDRKLLEAERVRLRTRAAQEFLDSAVAVLLPESMDYRLMLEKLAHIAISRLGDWCIIDLVQADGSIRQVAAAHADPDKEQIARELSRKFPAQQDLEHGVAYVIETGEPKIHPEIVDVSWLAEVLGTEHPEFLRSLGARSYMCVPLRGRGRTIGAMSLVRALPARRFDNADLELAVELGQRAGMAVENARLYDAAQEAVRARDEFMAIASHELRTPLATLKLLLQAIQGPRGQPEAALPKELEPKLDRALKQTDRLTKLIENLLEVSRITAGRLTLNLSDIDLAELVREVVGRFREEAASARCDLEVSAAEPVIGRWDRLRIEQIVTNLLSNALRYAPGKPIEIRVETTDKLAKLIVRDHGPGISREQWDRIFHRFERAEGTKAFAGLGLGLYIARQIVQAHGGRIMVEAGDGAGSKFVVELPREGLSRG